MNYVLISDKVENTCDMVTDDRDPRVVGVVKGSSGAETGRVGAGGSSSHVILLIVVG